MRYIGKRASSVRKSILASYMVSYMSLVLLSCALVGVLFFFFWVQDLRQTAIESTGTKMQMAVIDMQDQLLYCKDTALSISQDSAFRPVVFRQNKYYETELLNSLKQYRNASILSKTFFLVYYDSDIVYQSSGYINYFEPYSRQVLGIDGDAALLEQINGAQSLTILPIEGAEQFLIVIPVYTGAVYDTEGRASLCYVVDMATVTKRIQNITGGFDAGFELTYDGISLTGARFTPASDSFVLESGDGMLRLTLEIGPGEVYAGLSIFKATAIALFSALIVLLLGYAIYAAYRSYTPIRALASKLGVPRGSTLENELTRINQTFDELLQKEELTSIQLQEQLYILREQLLRLLFGGHFSQQLQRRLQLVGIQLPGPFYCVFSCTCTDGAMPEGQAIQNLLSLVEALSEAEILLYPCVENPGAIIVLASLSEAGLTEEVIDLLHSLFEAEDHGFNITAGQVCDNLQQIPVSYLSSGTYSENRQQTAEDEPPVYQDETRDPMERISQATERLLASVQEGDFDLTRASLDEIIAETKSTQKSMLVQRYIFNDVTTSMVRMGRKIELPLSERHIGALLTSSNVDSFYSAALDVLAHWRENMRMPEKKASPKDLTRVITYINENYLRYDLSLDSIAGLFHLSPAQLSRDFKQGTGQTYRDYLIKLRIEKAKQLLVEENLSVADTCQRIGYANISHFIKVFHRQTGMTPAKYKESMWQSANREHMAELP